MIKNELIKQIKKNDAGISLEKFIDISLFNKNGYYVQSNPIGKSGDFITAPEISQLFGEIIGLYHYDHRRLLHSESLRTLYLQYRL